MRKIILHSLFSTAENAHILFAELKSYIITMETKTMKLNSASISLTQIMEN